MVRATTITLLRENPEAHGVFDTPTETPVEVFAEVRSVTSSEYYRALSAGIEPELVFVLTDYADYNGEKVFLYEGVRWRVIRTYTRNMSIEITAGRATHDR